MNTNLKNGNKNVLSSIKILFYISKIFGLIPYSLKEYYDKNLLKVSMIGNIWCIFTMLQFSIQYHFANITFSLNDDGHKAGKFINFKMGKFFSSLLIGSHCVIVKVL